MKLTEKIFWILMVAFLLPMSLRPLSLRAQSEVLWVDQASFEPVQKDVVTGLRIDEIGRDRSNRPCARLKIHLNRMTPDEISATSLKPIGGNAVVMKNMISADQTGLIVEVTAVGELTFLLHNDKFGDSNPVTVALQPNREYLLKAHCRATYSINVMSSTVGAEVYLDRRMAGTIGPENTLTVSDVEVGPHQLELKYNGQNIAEKIEVDAKNIFFLMNFAVQETVINQVDITVEPVQAAFLLNGMALELDNGKKTLSIASGQHDYMVTADEYYPQEGSFVFTGKEPYELNIKLKPKFGLLDCSAVQPDCEVFLDDVSIGKSTLIRKYHLPQGRHTVRFEADRYFPKSIQANVTSGMQVRPEVALKPDFAELQIGGEVLQGAQVTLNENPVKTDSVYRMEPGAYRLLVRKEMYKEFKDVIVLAIGDVTRLEPELVPEFARINFKVPAEATVVIDGKPCGKGSGIIRVPYGEHEVSCALPRHRPSVKTLAVTPEMEGRTIALDTPELIAGTISITSQPDLASVYIDGLPAGETPFYSDTLAVGKHDIVLVDPLTSESKGFQVDISENKVYEFNKKIDAALRSRAQMDREALAQEKKEEAAERKQEKEQERIGKWGEGYKGIIYTFELSCGYQLNKGQAIYMNSGYVNYGNFTPIAFDWSIGYQFNPFVSFNAGFGICGNTRDLRPTKEQIEDMNENDYWNQDILDIYHYTDLRFKKVDLPVFANLRFHTNDLGNSGIQMVFSFSGGYYPLNKVYLAETGIGLATIITGRKRFNLMFCAKTTPWPEFKGHSMAALPGWTVGVKSGFTF